MVKIGQSGTSAADVDFLQMVRGGKPDTGTCRGECVKKFGRCFFTGEALVLARKEKEFVSKLLHCVDQNIYLERENVY